MIINTGARTDTAQWYAPWLLRRFEEGYVCVRNPRFPNKVSRYELDPAVVDCVEFCSKNYAPLLPHLHEITSRFNTHFHYTITVYGPDIEPEVPDLRESVDTLYALERQVDSRRICWRYDPVLLTGEYTVERHLETFSWLAGRLAGHVDRCIFSFVEMYKKLEHNFPELRHRGQRAGCGCFESRDIGAYDSCPNGCRYCYANRDHDKALGNYLHAHDPQSPLLLGHLLDDDEVSQAPQRSLLAQGLQLSLGI